MSSQLRVLFMHGTRGGPQDGTATYLSKYFNAKTLQMPVNNFKDCVKLESDTIDTFKPNVIVGESLGCAVAYELISQGKWTGPTVFMCPAVHRVLTRENVPLTVKFPKELPLVIIHGKRDDLIPMEDTQKLVDAANPTMTRLHVIDDDHGMTEVVKRDELRRYVEEAVALAKDTGN
ncbi:hypothetical protein HDU85_005702 [Gaertneriomyces sp. JEL0708]|nr:hypothetical protein HDU85_005702 [Gaertneriomyces sp. JEL0708]